MSVSNNIVGFAGKREENELIKDNKNMLEIRAALNQRYERANKQAAYDRLMQIPPPPSEIKTAEQEIKDQVLQNTRAFESLKKIMKTDDAGTVLSKLQTDGEVIDFNRFSALFLKEVENQKNITPAIFNLLWTRYKEKLLATGNTGIPIGAEKGEYELSLDAISNKLKMLGTAGRSNALDFKIEQSVNELMTYDLVSLLFKFRDAVEDEHKGAVPATLEIPDEYGNIEIKPTTLDPASGYPTDITPEDMIQYIIKWEYKVPSLLKLNYATKTIANPRKPLLISGAPKAPPGSALALYGSLPSLVDIEQAKKDYLDLRTKHKGSLSRIKGMKTILENIFKILIKTHPNPGTIGTPTTIASYETAIQKLMPREYQKYRNSGGKGLPNPLRSAVSGKQDLGVRYVRGSGFEKIQDPIITPGSIKFGNYNINLKALNKGYLHLLYPSGSYIVGKPKKMISSDLASLFMELVFNKNFDENVYDELDDDDKKIFDETIDFCHVDKWNNVDLFKHKKIFSKERKEDIKKFEVLKGELLAGNDNPILIKDLKAIILKLLNNKVISKSEANKILYEIFILN